ncbi:TonB-dependent receptor [Alteromonadaceae bacterium M269]|nr:TonB-dependent receptor [Alteromonadaceae bacterium M269]
MNNKILVSVAVAIALTQQLTYAQEQSNEEEVERISVLAQRQAYRGDFSALETPQANQIIDAEILQSAGALDLVQALDLSASVSRQNNFGGLWNSFAIRGFVGDGNLPSNFLVNGFNAGRGFGGPRDISGVESVEILKGPRAALFGRGEPGGTINLVTKRPTFEKEGRVSLSAGSFDTYRTDFDYTTPLSDLVAIRLVGFYEDAESFRDTIETRKQGLSPSIAFQFNDTTQLVYELEYSDQEIPFDRGVIAINGELGLIPDSRFLGEPGDGPIETHVIGHQVEFQHDFNEDWSALVGFNTRGTTLRGNATENGFADPDAEGNFGRFFRFRNYNASYEVFRAELTGSFDTGSLEHRIIVGVDSDEFENDQLALRDRTTNQDINIFNPVFGAVQLPLLDPQVNGNLDMVETQESIGLYIQDQISITDKLDIRIGARFDDYEQELVNRRFDTVSEFSETRVSPQFGVVYKVNDAVSVYAVYGENFRPLSGATDDNGLEPNQSESKEIGVNFELFNGNLSGNVTLFDVDQSNIATVDGDFNPTALGEAGSQGFEVDLNGYITDTLSVWLSYSFVDAETKNAYNDPDFGTEVPAGADLINIPENQLSLQVMKEMEFAGKELNLIGGLLYVDDRNGFFVDQSFRLPSYTTVRVAASYKVTDSITLRAEVNNLFDEEHYTNSFANVWVQPGTPVNGRLTADFRF